MVTTKSHPAESDALCGNLVFHQKLLFLSHVSKKRVRDYCKGKKENSHSYTGLAIRDVPLGSDNFPFKKVHHIKNKFLKNLD